MIGLKVNGLIWRKDKQKTEEGREELTETFHKSVINNIVMGLSLVDKAKDNGNKDIVDKMYLYEAVYYYKMVEIEIENMDLFIPENDECNQKLLEKIGLETLDATIKVYQNGVDKLYGLLSEECSEKEDISHIRTLLETYGGMITRYKKKFPYVKNEE